MFLKIVVALSCIAVTLASDGYYLQPQVYVHEQPRHLSEHLNSGLEYGNHAARGYDHGGLRNLQHLQSGHGASNFGAGNAHALRDLAVQNHHDQGAHAALHSAGAQEGHIRKAHDRGLYEREKKYGYEKGYGYERETKHHDRNQDAQSYGSGYKHNENRDHYNRGANALRDLASHGNRYQHGSNAYGHNNALIDVAANHNRGSDILSNYGRDFKLRDLNVARPQPVVVYQPEYVQKSYLPGIGNSLDRFRYLSLGGINGLHGLGGIRGYGLGYNQSPLQILSPSQSHLGLGSLGASSIW
ncbi:uncharacterized protein LOC118191206 [Stegodyphus dumicola]|uniref:uncharacterized protein LOC118191206 n=1 Tax=Stegodyphus dumicola TaxID=202533 RepID=UPI0015AD50E4|nr:uncharacterized protein LOC118191206 [Stegodyphus dumicola]